MMVRWTCKSENIYTTACEYQICDLRMGGDGGGGCAHGIHLTDQLSRACDKISHIQCVCVCVLGSP